MVARRDVPPVRPHRFDDARGLVSQPQRPLHRTVGGDCVEIAAAPAAGRRRPQTAAGCCQAVVRGGPSPGVQPAASLALAARAGGALLVEISLETPPLSGQADECLSGKAGEILPRLTEAIKNRLAENLQ